MKEFKLIKTTYPYYWVKKAKDSVGVIFYVHGFADQPDMFWMKFNPIQNYDIYAVELPGHFETPIASKKDLNPIRYGQLCIELIKNLKLKNVILMGHSMGGEIATHIAAQMPEVIEKLILVSPANSHCTSMKSIWQLLTNFIPQTQSKINQFYRHLMWDKHAAIFSRALGPAAVDNFITRKANYKILKNRLSSLTNLIHMRNNEKALRSATLVILGIHDGTINYAKTSKYFNKLNKNIKIATFEKSGHMAYLEEPELFNTVVNAYIKN